MNRDYTSISRVLVITFLLNFLSAVAKLATGFLTGALSLIADGLDTLFDGLTNLVGLVAVRKSRQPPDDEHPYGHRKFETIAALVVVAALFITAWELASSAIHRLMEPSVPTVNKWVIGSLLFSMMIQAGAGLWETKKAEELNSELLKADGRHTLASVAASGAVLIGLGLVWLGFAWADPLVALLMAGLIAKVGIDIALENIPLLVDRAALNVEEIGNVVGSVEGVTSYHRIRSRGPKDYTAIDLHIRVDPGLSVQDANAIADEVRRRLLTLPGVVDVTVHTEAQRRVNGSADIRSTARLAAQELGLAIHECWVQEVDRELSLHLHVGADPALTLAEAHTVVDQLERTILERQPRLNTIHSHIELAGVEILPSAPVSTHLQQRVRRSLQDIVEAIPELNSPHDIQVRQVEGRLFITVETHASGSLSVDEAHDLSTILEESARKQIPNVGDVLVHVEPETGAGA